MCKCGNPENAPGSRYCRACANTYMREWRKTHPLTDEQKVKASARSIAKVYRARGKLVPKPCERCSSKRVEMHHDDYSKPLQVRWLCRLHHRQLHREVWLAEDLAALGLT